jgi:hypothetical protein
MEVSGQIHAPAALPPGKQLRYPLDRRLGGPQSQSGPYGEEKNRLLLQGIEPWLIGRPALTDVEDKYKKFRNRYLF